MKKSLLLCGVATLVCAQAASAETFSSPMADTGWSFSSGTATATGVVSMKMLMQSSTTIKKNHWYRVTGTVSGYTGTGALRAFAGYSMPAAPTGAWVTAASYSDVADNFTTSLGLETGATVKTTGGPGDSAEIGGAFRFQCTHAWFGLEDPVVAPNLSSGHIHEAVGNTQVSRKTTRTTLRTYGSSTCGDSNDPTHPVNRSGYWWPGVINTKKAALVKINGSQIYYKGPSLGTLNYTGSLPGSENAALYCSEVSPTNTCVNVPPGMTYITGYNKSTGNCGPLDTTSACTNEGQGFTFSCHTSPQTGGTQIPNGVTTYQSMEAARASGNCSVGGQLKIGLIGPNCWDGVNIDSPNHRGHIAFGRLSTAHFGNSGCPSTHPVNIPTFSAQNWYTIDQDFMDGYWHLTSDEMVNGAVAGSTSHLDYMWGWSPTAASTWYNRCIQNHNSCSSGELGDGTRIKMGGGMNADGSEQAGNGGSLTRPDRYVPTRFYGMGPDIKANGSFSVDIRAADDGWWGLMGLNSLNATVTSVTLTEISTGAKGPVTVHN